MDNLNYFYFIGRTNPPTSGHIYIFTKMIELAKQAGTKAIILLGSGPKGGVLSLDDPITYDLKEEVLNYLLGNLGFKDYIIQKKEEYPAMQICRIVDNLIKESGEVPGTITVSLVAGNKPDKKDPTRNDLSKNQWMYDSISNCLQAKYPKVITNGIPIEPMMTDSVAMSATSVRKDAYKFYLNSGKDFDKAFSEFQEKYNYFYNGFTRVIFSQILNPLIDYSPRKIKIQISDDVLSQYIVDPESVRKSAFLYEEPKASKTKKRKIGGTKRTKRSKRKSSKRN